jgi:hypothetical protein
MVNYLQMSETPAAALRGWSSGLGSVIVPTYDSRGRGGSHVQA